MEAKNLKIGQHYLVTLYNVIPGTGIKDRVKAIYKGITTEKTHTTNEVHGFVNNFGLLCVLSEDIEKRVCKY